MRQILPESADEEQRTSHLLLFRVVLLQRVVPFRETLMLVNHVECLMWWWWCIVGNRPLFMLKKTSFGPNRGFLTWKIQIILCVWSSGQKSNKGVGQE